MPEVAKLAVHCACQTCVLQQYCTLLSLYNIPKKLRLGEYFCSVTDLQRQHKNGLIGHQTNLKNRTVVAMRTKGLQWPRLVQTKLLCDITQVNFTLLSYRDYTANVMLLERGTCHFTVLEINVCILIVGPYITIEIMLYSDCGRLLLLLLQAPNSTFMRLHR